MALSESKNFPKQVMTIALLLFDFLLGCLTSLMGLQHYWQRKIEQQWAIERQYIALLRSQLGSLRSN